MWITFLDKYTESIYFCEMEKFTEIPKAAVGRPRIYDFEIEVGYSKTFDYTESIRQSAYKYFKDRGWGKKTRTKDGKFTIYRTA